MNLTVTERDSSAYHLHKFYLHVDLTICYDININRLDLVLTLGTLQINAKQTDYKA